jgi:hypothetical protein
LSENPGSSGQEKRHELDEEYRKLWELRDASEGAKILLRNRAMTNSYRVFEGNLAELKKFLDHIATPTVMAHMWAEKHGYRLDYARRDVSRLLHNYVASALSLADATRYFVDKHYAGTDLYDDYELRKNRDFAEAPLHNFMNRLRVYTLHLQLPAVTPIAHAERREDGGFDFDNTFWLDVERLRDWDRWTAKAREYLATLGSKARLMDIINAYEPVVTGFHEWLSDRISEEHAAAIEEVRDLERRMDEVWRELHGDLDQDSPAQELPERESILASLAGPSLDDEVNNLATLDDIIFSLYESVSFPHGGLPNLDRFRGLFLRDTRLVKVEAHGTYLTNINDHIRDFHHTLNEGAKTQVSEYEVSRRTNTLGDTAHVLSEHETVYVENGSRKRARGYYSLHLVKAGGRWCITDMHIIDEQSFTTRKPTRSEPEVSVAEQYTTKTVQVRSLEPREDAEIPLFEAPFDGLIANVTFTPSEEIRGAYTSRGELQLYVDPRAGSRHIVSSIQLGSPEILLPGGERHNAPLLMPPSPYGSAKETPWCGPPSGASARG